MFSLCTAYSHHGFRNTPSHTCTPVPRSRHEGPQRRPVYPDRGLRYLCKEMSPGTKVHSQVLSFARSFPSDSSILALEGATQRFGPRGVSGANGSAAVQWAAPAIAGGVVSRVVLYPNTHLPQSDPKIAGSDQFVLLRELLYFQSHRGGRGHQHPSVFSSTWDPWEASKPGRPPQKIHPRVALY
jgi:hypothetical protein